MDNVLIKQMPSMTSICYFITDGIKFSTLLCLVFVFINYLDCIKRTFLDEKKNMLFVYPML